MTTAAEALFSNFKELGIQYVAIDSSGKFRVPLPFKFVLDHRNRESIQQAKLNTGEGETPKVPLFFRQRPDVGSPVIEIYDELFLAEYTADIRRQADHLVVSDPARDAITNPYRTFHETLKEANRELNIMKWVTIPNEIVKVTGFRSLEAICAPSSSGEYFTLQRP